jgi:hypothetical protein
MRRLTRTAGLGLGGEWAGSNRLVGSSDQTLPLRKAEAHLPSVSLSRQGAAVTSRTLLAVFDSVYVIALATWLGSSVFFALGIAPILEKALDGHSAARFGRAIVPRYYLWGAIAGAVALPAFVAGPLCYHEFRGAMVGVQALGIILGILIMLYGGNSLAPALEQTRDDDSSNRERLARRAIRLSMVVSVLVCFLLVRFAMRPAPRTSGIVEMTPVERARYDAAISRVIQNAEAKHDMRSRDAPRPDDAAIGEKLIDQGTIDEIDSYFAKKRQRDAERAPRRGLAAPEVSSGSAKKRL